MKRQMVWGVVEANVFQVVVAGFAGVLKRCGLKDGHCDGAQNAGLGLSGVDEFRFKALKRRFHGNLPN
jgi:hypothetical protein